MSEWQALASHPKGWTQNVSETSFHYKCVQDTWAILKPRWGGGGEGKGIRLLMTNYSI